MFNLRSLAAIILLLCVSGAHAQTNTFATGNMHFDAKDMDTNGDKMITRAEMMKYGEQMWDKMANGKDTIPIAVASKDFATGGLAFNARAMDTDHDGTISKEEFLAYAGRKFDKMKKTDGMIPVADAAKAFSRGNPHPSQANESTSPPK
ncbi:MAG: hypothetical protein JWN85_1933 [Gammaproteobacteria bacterium]|nr:hypothetical protein [Gammaproteobacteria bacterium]